MSNLGYGQDSNGHKKSGKNQKNDKPKHIAFLCHIVSIKVDKQGLDIFKPDNHVDLMKSSMKRSRIGFKHWNFKNLPKASF